ncbi:MAG: DUF2760 domain-containing protein [Proteobacteria bacterium]|nr:DUF2760 domain-containing protein [Pseudomonadota bacterium]MBU1389523.1 DUF2760 domain-containing protein [Pseudomonadota bacterium]MBU1541343.1 DUF2760 domain-containing protein [Pseudomonadota bacterium]MBU2430601.1 DUF2760 domain-containing protein [Pseudomonadota bacterium]MBU2482916.1 DUF2760 domain-containing protein [Pseudomonadota bacterium]
MEISKRYSKRSFWVITLLFMLIAAGVSAELYFGIEWVLNHFSRGVAQDAVLKKVSFLVDYIEWADLHLYKIVIPAVVGVILIKGWMLWLVLKLCISGIFKLSDPTQEPVLESGKKKKDFIDQRIEQDRKRRLFLHTLSVFQRDGRLLDFFQEDLSLYEDEQIGAAVRSIQEDCKKAVKKYIDPEPVIEDEEGSHIVVENGFDIDSIKLIGNISGNPPFEGILRHRGWKAGKKEIPKLSDIQDSTVITPAEVEIQ